MLLMLSQLKEGSWFQVCVWVAGGKEARVKLSRQTQLVLRRQKTANACKFLSGNGTGGMNDTFTKRRWDTFSLRRPDDAFQCLREEKGEGNDLMLFLLVWQTDLHFSFFLIQFPIPPPLALQRALCKWKLNFLFAFSKVALTVKFPSIWVSSLWDSFKHWESELRVNWKWGGNAFCFAFVVSFSTQLPLNLSLSAKFVFTLWDAENFSIWSESRLSCQSLGLFLTVFLILFFTLRFLFSCFTGSLTDTLSESELEFRDTTLKLSCISIAPFFSDDISIVKSMC